MYKLEYVICINISMLEKVWMSVQTYTLVLANLSLDKNIQP